MKTSFKRSWQLLIILHSVKTKRIKGTSQDWFDAEIMDKINDRDRLGKPKGLWKSLKSLGLKFERFISNINCLENDISTYFDVKDIAKDFSA